MARRILQPCDWYEHDNYGSYVVDVFGRTNSGTVACVRIKGFKPYFYVKGPRPQLCSAKVTSEAKYDVFAGFNDLKTTDVWKVECNSKADFMEAAKSVKGVLYETNLPPFLRLFHSRHIGPASPISFVPHPFTIPVDRETQEPLYNIDEFYQCDVSEVGPADANIPLKVACYDLEMYSKSGLFPQAKKGDPIVQIGISYRWSDKMLDPIRRVVFVVGSVDESEDEGVEFMECEDEEDMLRAFCDEVRGQNPDVMCGYNTFGFDDAYIEDRCRELGIAEEIDLSRFQ